jgi:hypothetical protein
MSLTLSVSARRCATCPLSRSPAAFSRDTFRWLSSTAQRTRGPPWHTSQGAQGAGGRHRDSEYNHSRSQCRKPGMRKRASRRRPRSLTSSSPTEDLYCFSGRPLSIVAGAYVHRQLVGVHQLARKEGHLPKGHLPSRTSQDWGGIVRWASSSMQAAIGPAGMGVAGKADAMKVDRQASSNQGCNSSNS